MTTKTANKSTSTANKEKNMTAKTTTAPSSNPKPTVRKSTKKVAAAETNVPEPTEQQKARMFSTAMGAVTRALKAAQAVEITEDDRTLDRANHLYEKVVAAKKVANERAAAAGKELPFTTEDTTFKPIERDPMDRPSKNGATESLRATIKANKARAAEAEKPAASAKFDIVLRNMSDGSVEGHAAGCADLKRKAKRGAKHQSDEAWSLSVSSKHDAWEEYNSDFLNECEEHKDHAALDACSHAYNIDWLPCADGVADRDGEPEPTKEPFKATAPKARAAAGTKKAGAAKATTSGTTTAKEKAPAKATAAKVVVTPAQRSETKAAELGKFATEHGWTSSTEEIGAGAVRITLKHDDEEMGAVFTDGKLGLEPAERPYYTNAERGNRVLLRNVSAMRMQIANEDGDKPVARVATRAVRTHAADRPRKTFTWDNALDDKALLDALQTEMTGKRVLWDVTLDGTTEEMEVLIAKVTKVGTTPSNDRTVDFFEMEITKAGLKPSRQRTITLKSIKRLV